MENESKSFFERAEEVAYQPDTRLAMSCNSDEVMRVLDTFANLTFQQRENIKRALDRGVMLLSEDVFEIELSDLNKIYPVRLAEYFRNCLSSIWDQEVDISDDDRARDLLYQKINFNDPEDVYFVGNVEADFLLNLENSGLAPMDTVDKSLINSPFWRVVESVDFGEVRFIIIEMEGRYSLYIHRLRHANPVQSLNKKTEIGVIQEFPPLRLLE